MQDDISNRLSPFFCSGLSEVAKRVDYYTEGDMDLSESLRFYYISMIRNYKVKAKRVLLEPTQEEKELALTKFRQMMKDFREEDYIRPWYIRNAPVNDIILGVFGEENYFEHLSKRVNIVDETLDLFLEELESEFENRYVIGAFYFLGLVFCLDPVLLLTQPMDLYSILIQHPHERKRLRDVEDIEEYNNDSITRLFEDELENTFVLCNDTGAFSIGSYLYAFANGINLLGVPSQISPFDEQRDCTIVFMEHDIEHIRDIESLKRLDTRKKVGLDRARAFVKSEMNTILISDSTKEEKELLLLGLWYLFHEIYRLPPINKIPFRDYFQSKKFQIPAQTVIYPIFTSSEYKKALKDLLYVIPKEDRIYLVQKLGTNLKENLVGPLVSYLYNYYSRIINER